MSQPTTPMPPRLVATLELELSARLEIRDIGTPKRPVVAVVFGDELHAVRIIGLAPQVDQLIVEADRQLTRLAHGGGR